MAQKLQYPNTRRVDHVDTYFGVKVPDPYRWLEDDNAPETMKWVEAENKVTFKYLDKIPFRSKIKARLEKLFNYPRYGAPFRNGRHFFFSKNDGLQNQSVLYMQKGLEGTPELLIDPNTFSADSTSQLAEFALSKDGKYFAYGISQGGSDWRDVHVMEIAGRKTLPDLLKWVKVSDLAWQGNGFYYSRYDAPAQGKELTSSNDDHKVYYHRIGSPQAEDELVYQDKTNPQRFHQVQTTEDERFAILYISDRGKGKEGEALFVRDAAKTDKKWIPLIPEIGDDHYYAIDNIGAKFLIQTNRKAPNWKVVLIDPKKPEEKNWKVVLPEKPEPLQRVGTAGGKLFASKDGTRVPMFLVHKKGLKLDGNNPTLLYGYGGFSNTIPPSFSPLRLALLEQGVIYASANIRGGAEYGEKWHEAGTKLKKQNVFDDFIAAAEYLIAKKYTSSARLAVQGASNGGLLVGALANQRPDLVKVVIQQAGVMDMLRFHKFTIGWNWVADYGSSDNEAEFKVLRAYSPIHNIKEGAKYPATFITTADHDDRVVPAHSFKYAAALQHGQGGVNPVLIRIDTKSGHGASNTAKTIEQAADIDSFLLWNLGVTPKY